MAQRISPVSKRRIAKKDGLVTDTSRVVRAVSYGTLAVTILLAALLFCYDIAVIGHFRLRTFLSLAFLGYTLLAVVLARKGYNRTASWMVIGLYQLLVAIMLFQWGIKAPVSVLALCFVTILPGVLLGSRYIFPVLLYTILLLFGTQLLQSLHLHMPNIAVLSGRSSYWDVAIYVTVIAILALVSWLSKSQTEQSLRRALAAESRVKDQKQLIADELKQESLKLRQMQLKQFRQLYQFALIGQSTAATLHELSNQLAELNFDIEDLTQHTKNSQAIADAKETIGHINLTVRQVRQQLNTDANDREIFNPVDTIKRAVDDIQPKYNQRQVRLIYSAPIMETAQTLFGSRMALLQILSILLHNALHASQDAEKGWVQLSAKFVNDALEIRIIDSGAGIDDATRKILFTPKSSTKPNGLGIGLYIAKHLVKTQFHGRIQLASSAKTHGAEFIISLPVSKTQDLDSNEK